MGQKGLVLVNIVGSIPLLLEFSTVNPVVVRLARSKNSFDAVAPRCFNRDQPLDVYMKPITGKREIWRTRANKSASLFNPDGYYEKKGSKPRQGTGRDKQC